MDKLLWVRQDQETTGSYFFNGTLLVTSGVQRLLSKQELEAIITDVQGFVAKENGIDYLIVYKHPETERKIFCIDQLNKEMIDSGGHPPEHNHWTILLAEEY